MRRSGLVAILLVVVFMLPMTSPIAGPDADSFDPTDLSPYDGGTTISQSGDMGSGTGTPLQVSLNGVVSNVGEGAMQITSATPGTSSVTLANGWTGTDLAAQVDSLSMTTSNVLRNGDLNKYHSERFLVSSTVSYNGEAHPVPDSWTLYKNVLNDNDPHPNHGVYEIRASPSGYSGTYGLYVESQYSTSYNHNPNDEVFIGQMISLPWREVYSAQISFKYYVSSSSTMTDKLHLFTRLGGYVTKYHVFESGDQTNTWLTATATMQAGSLQGLANRVIELDIGLASDLTGTQASSANYYAYIDDVQVTFVVRPFPEQIDLKANGTIVWGSTSGSVYPYVPDGASRDCWDYTSGIDLDGYSNDGNIEVGIYGSDWTIDSDFQLGLQFPVDVPQGAIITSAWVEMEAQGSTSPYLYGVRVYVADADTVSAFTTGLPHLENRYSWVPTSIDWSFNSWITSPTTRYRSPEMGSLIQKVVTRSGWSEGNYICLMIDYMNSDYFQRYNNIKGSVGWSQEELARLYVEYVVPEPEDHVVFFDYQKTITIDHTKVAGTLTDFPVLIDRVDADLKDHLLSGGNDIAFTLNGQPLDHEIEMFDSDTGHLVAWVKVPSLSNTVDTTITMHYGCQDAPATTGSRVWDDYETVHHLNQDPTVINIDSTSNNHDGTSYGGLGTSDIVAGQIGNGIDFDGSDDVISIGQIDTDEWTKFTMSAWFYRTLDKDARIFSKSTTTTSDQHIMTLRLDPTNHVTTRLWANPQAAGVSYSSTATASNFTWHYVSWSWDPSRTGHEVLAYLDGVLIIDRSYTGTSIYDSDAMFVIGNNDLLNDRYWAGIIDEVRLTTSVRSEEWIDTEYSNQLNPSGFYTVGSEIATPDRWTDAGETEVVFTTSNPFPVTLDINLTMDISGNGQTLDEDLDPGTSFFIASGSNLVNWTAKVMVSPPAGATSFGFSIEYPMAEWKPTKVLNPFNAAKAYPSDWSYQAGTLTIESSAIDFWGIWTLKFISWNFAQNLLLGKTGETLSTTATFNIGDSMKYLATTPSVQGATVGFILTDPNGAVQYSGSNTTITNPAHKFPSFQYRKDFTIPDANIYESVQNFPFALDFIDTDLHNPSKVRADGSDIMFAMGDTILPHQIEYFKQDYTVTDARLVVWICANLTDGMANTISMYYGSVCVDHLEDSQGVWRSDYEAVWHLGEDVVDEGSGAIHYDATGNGYNGIQHGNVETLTSKIGYAQSFDGNDYISFSEDLAPPDNVMITGWFRLTSTHSPTTPTTKVIMEKYIDINHDMVIALVGQDYGQGTVPNGSLVFKVESSPNDPMYKWTTTTTWNPGWYYIACYANESDPSKNKIFVGTALVSDVTDAGYIGSATQANMSYIEEWRLGGGNFESSYNGTGWFTGQMDEFRVATAYRSLDWLRTEYDNQAGAGSFATKGSEQARTSPNHTFTQTLTSVAPAGVWTASIYYNDTGTTVSTRTGLFERTFTVKRNTYLTLAKPLDAVGDLLSVKTAGDAVTIEYDLKDSLNDDPIDGATVTINWTSPSTVTLDSYGGGKYGKILDTNDLASAKRWRINVQSTHPYYNDANAYFDIDLFHNTGLESSSIQATPVGYDFTATVTFTDAYTGTPIVGATITFGDDSPVKSYVDEGGGVYNVNVSSTALSLGQHTYTLKATAGNSYLKTATVSVTFNLRAHYTSVSVQGDLVTPYQQNTQVTIVLIDLDTGQPVSIGSVSSFSFTSSQSPDTFSSPSSFTVTLTTDDWIISAGIQVTFTVTMSSSDYLAPSQYNFIIEIRPHRTTLTVSGVVTQPYGNVTPVTVVLTDLDSGSIVPIGAVNQMLFQWIGGSQPLIGSYSVSLGTDTWPVGTRLVTVITTMASSAYYAPANYQFTITIRKMTTALYYDPAPFIFPNGVDFYVNLRLNVSEPGQYYGDPIQNRGASEFSVPGYAFSLDTSDQAIGRYNLTISESYFGDGVFEFRIYFHSADSRYADASVLVRVTYRPIISYLTSPNYPQVTTPFGMDVQITLNYTDADFGTGIGGATVYSPDHPTWVYGQVDLTGGLYTVWISVTGLAQGTHNISLTADKSGYDAKTLQFRIVIRAAYTSVIPSVGALVIPLGSSVTFYADYTDLDRILPIDNNTGDTNVVSGWSRFTVEYVSGIQRYRIVFQTLDTDAILSNVVYTFTFSKGVNYQPASFNISVTIRTHNTEFRLVSSIEPTSTIGTFNISVYYGDLDNAIGIVSSYFVIRVYNESGANLVSFTYENDTSSGAGFYLIHVPASQFGLGVQSFLVQADWTGPYSKYQDKSVLVSATVVGRESSLALLLASDPTPYGGIMSYTLFFSDTGVGIINGTGGGYVLIYVTFPGETVDFSKLSIVDEAAAGEYSIHLNTTMFTRIGLIYMNVHVNWSKGIAPYYANRTDVISVRVLPRDTLLSITPPSSTSYDENATISLTFEDTTGGSSTLITGLTKQEISLNISFSITESAGIYEISFNTNQFGGLGVKAIRIDVIWVGSPFYANRTGRITYINVISRETYLEYLTPPPTQYNDQVAFNVTWTDVLSSTPITSATLVLKDGATPLGLGSDYNYYEIAPGVYHVTLNTNFSASPGIVPQLRVEMSPNILDFYYASRAINRQFTILERTTVVAANPVADVPFGSDIIIILSYVDLSTEGSIANDSAHGYPVTLEVLPSGETYTSTWRAVSENYELIISWNPSWDATWIPGTIHSFTIRMSYDYTSPFYAENQAYVTFEIRIRDSSLDLDAEPETTPYLDDITFTVFYSDDDAGGAGIASADISILGLTETTDFAIIEGSPGYYTITVYSTSLGSIGTHVLEVHADRTGEPYHAGSARNVSVLVRPRDTNLEITVPPAQTLYLDNVTFQFVFNDLDVGTPISLVDLSIIHLYWEANGTEIDPSKYSLVLNSGVYEVTASSTILSAMPITGLSIRVTVDWPVAQAPFYADDFTIAKVTITRRSILVETEQIERTPKGDILNITINLSDLDNGAPITGAIIQFNCQGQSLVEGIDYIYTPGAGVYTFNVDTMSLTGTGTFRFDIGVQWNPSLSPFYSNRSIVTLTGLVDLVRTSLQVNALVPNSVQYTGTVSLNITWTDLDHGLPVTGYAAVIDSNVKYLVSGLRPAGLIVTEYGSSGVYNITFNTSDLSVLGPYTLKITAAVSVYASVTVTPQFNVVAINTVVNPVETSITAYWKSPAIISVDYHDTLNDLPISSASSVTWEYISGGVVIFEGALTETGTPGRYNDTIDTKSFGSGTFVLTITATKNMYKTSITTITLVVLTIPSEIIIHQPIGASIDVSRGSSIGIEVQLWDTTYGLTIDNTQVRNEMGNLQVYAFLNQTRYYMTYNAGTGRWNVTIPGSATILEALLSYDIRIFANFLNYDPAANQFKIYIIQSETQIRVIDTPDPTKLEVYYLQEVTINLTFTSDDLPPYPWVINDGRVSWIDSTRSIFLNFTSVGNGVWSLTFNTTILGFGTVGVTFYGYPTNSTLGNTIQSMTLTVKKVPTHVVYPTEDLYVIWGWSGNISLGFHDDYNNRFVSGASVEFNYGNKYYNATDLKNGNYSLFIDTTLLDSNSREKISVTFILPNFEEWTIAFYIRVLERPTELLVTYPDQNFAKIEQGILYLVLTMGDSITISLFYNDTSLVGGLFGGIIGANFSEFTEMRAPSYFEASMPIIFNEGFGFYNFTFDTNNLALFGLNNNTPIIQEGAYFRHLIEIFDANRELQTLRLYISLRTITTKIVHDGQIVDPDEAIVYTLTNGDHLTFDFLINDTWHGAGAEGFTFDITQGSTAEIRDGTSTGNGYYTMTIFAVGYGGDAVVTVVLHREFYDDVEINFLIHTEPNDFDTLLLNVRNYGLPISILIITLLGLYVRVWSVPKRIRQINGQIKTVRKGKVPKPVSDVKSRQQLVADLFNDTYEKMKITRTAAQMPEEGVLIAVPEMGELLIQLAILTNLNADELEDFKADISKMKMSEQAAFVKEVIMQEAIRAARRDEKTIEETLGEVQKQAAKRLVGEEFVEPRVFEEEKEVETVLLTPEEEPKEPVVRERKEPEVKKVEPEEAPEPKPERMSTYEIEELRKDLERRGVPPYEIDTILEQARELPRELVEELVKSLEENEK